MEGQGTCHGAGTSKARNLGLSVMRARAVCQPRTVTRFACVTGVRGLITIDRGMCAQARK